MEVIHIGTAVYGAEPIPQSPDESKKKHDGIIAALNAPIYLGVVNAVNYDMKTDRYAGVFTPGEGKKLTLRIMPSVAEFLSQHITRAGYWLGRMGEDGILHDVYLIQAD